MLCIYMHTLCACVYGTHIGYGASRLRSFRGHGSARYMLSAEDPEIQELRFSEAVIDNFAPIESQRTWNGPGGGQRYWVNTRFCSSRCSNVFIYIGGEGPESGKHISEGSFIHDLASDHGALLITLEHRFYGQSYPLPDMSTDSLAYLTSQQALADLARFITAYKQNTTIVNDDAKWVSFGGSYPGNLSAWLRLKYPHLVVGAVASSAPVLAQLDFPEYMDIVKNSLYYFGGQECVDAIAEGASAVYDMLQTSAGKSTIQTDFTTCDDITSEDDVWIFATNFLGDYQESVQYNRERLGAVNVSDICTAMTSTTPTYNGASDAYDKIVNMNKIFRAAANSTCLDVSWDDSITELMNTTFDGESSSRQWTYQTCNEFGYYQTATSLAQPFSSFGSIMDLESFLHLCEVVYTITALPPVEWTNSYYGGLGIDTTYVVFPSGSLDPWSALSIIDDTPLVENLRLPYSIDTAVYIDGTAHCADMKGRSVNILPQVTQAQYIIADKVKGWLDGSSPTCDEGGEGMGIWAALGLGLGCFVIGILTAVGGVWLMVHRKRSRGVEMIGTNSINAPLLANIE